MNDISGMSAAIWLFVFALAIGFAAGCAHGTRRGYVCWTLAVLLALPLVLRLFFIAVV
jgi:hypothetical protein